MEETVQITGNTVDTVVETIQSGEVTAEQVEAGVIDLVDMIQSKIPELIGLGIRVLIALVVFFVGRAIIRFIRKQVKTSMEKANVDAGVTQFTQSLLKFGLYLLLILVVASNLGFDLSTITVAFASASVGITLALQGTLSNFAGGVLILVTRPFVVGDYIIEDNKKNEGTVKEIGIFNTKLTTLDNKTIVIPNGTLANNSLTNVSEKEERQLDLKISISYDADLRRAKAILAEQLVNQEAVIVDQPTNIFVDSLGDSAVVLGLRAWVKNDEYWKTRWALLEDIKLALDKEGIEIPYNQLTVHVNKEQEN
ncbi:MAG: mechanosensitive ion channel family protein [Schaedlerella sp.]|nr:mechanosensitive ion channel family protein [Schaedlerella sp.]